MTDFGGAKLMLLDPDRRILTYLRDDFAHLPFPGQWDLPGGGREGDETPEACVLRELEEEFALSLPPDRLLWRRLFPGMLDPARHGWFFAGRMTVAEVAAIRFGDEGQHWQMMPLHDWLDHTGAIAELQRRCRAALDDLGW